MECGTSREKEGEYNAKGSCRIGSAAAPRNVVFVRDQPARVRLYLSARACRVPSAFMAAISSLTLAVRSEP